MQTTFKSYDSLIEPPIRTVCVKVFNNLPQVNLRKRLESLDEGSEVFLNFGFGVAFRV